jgi:transglutaminase-like putative cysteine protease
MRRFMRSFTISTYMLAFAGMLCLAVSAGESWLLIPIVPVLAAGLIADLGGKTLLGKRAATAAAFLFLGLLIADWLAVSGFLPLALAHFLLAIAIIKLLSVKTNRDYAQIYFISFMHLAVSAVVANGVSFAVIFILYMVLAIWTLLLFHVKRAAEPAPATGKTEGAPLTGAAAAAPRPAPMPERVLSPRFYMLTALVAVFTLCLTGILFLAIPRIGARLFNIATHQKQRITGFSDSLSFNDLGAIAESDEVVLRVKILGGRIPREGLYLRGACFAEYDGRKWLRPYGERMAPVQHTVSEGMKRFTTGRDYGPREELCRQEIIREPLSSKALFAAPEPVRFDFTSKEAPNLLDTDGQGNYFCPAEPTMTISYIASSRMFDNYKALSSALAPGYRIRGVDYTALPDVPHNTRWQSDMYRLAAQIARDADARTAYEKAAAVRKYIMENCRYTLNVSHDPDEEAVHEFLFTTKAGHCELAASAMALLCRAEGIPARVVAGFKGGEINEYGDEYYIFRQRHAHAWVEVFFDEDDIPWNPTRLGWVAFDPTTSARMERISSFWDYLNYSWTRWVIAYTYEDQKELARSIGSGIAEIGAFFSSIFEGIFDTFRSIGDFKAFSRNLVIGLVIIVLAVFGGMYLLTRSMKKRGRESGAKTRLHSAVRFYNEFQRLLARHGRPRPINFTPNEYLVTLEADGRIPMREASLVTSAFVRVRYGEAELTEEEIEATECALDELKTALQNPSGARGVQNRISRNSRNTS